MCNHLFALDPRFQAESLTGIIVFAVLELAIKLPLRSAVISPAEKLPDPSRKTQLSDALLGVEATLIVVSPLTPSALVSVIPELPVTCKVLCAKVLAAVLTT